MQKELLVTVSKKKRLAMTRGGGEVVRPLQLAAVIKVDYITQADDGGKFTIIT